MKITSPKIKSTISSQDCREWVPTSLDNLLREIDHITRADNDLDSLPLFRGQTNKEWSLDSTFVRDSIQKLFKLDSYQLLPKTVRHQVSFHRAIASLLLMKFDAIYKPSQEAFDKEISHGIDPWYELLKNIKQYPEKHNLIYFIQGTFFIDWTSSQDIALYFSTFDGVGPDRKISQNDGAIWIYDSSKTGNILKEDKLATILNKMTTTEFLNGERTFPLMFHPNKQTNQLRAKNQVPIYLAQMDFRYDLADVWASYENQKNK